jgi:cysteine desulfurase
MIGERIFLDAHATTRTDPAVIEAMVPWLQRAANSHSAHAMGEEAAAAVERARADVAALIGAGSDEIVFVPSATIAANIALRSLARPDTVAVMSAIEHPCVAETLNSLQPNVRIAKVPVNEEGLVDPDDVASVLEGASVAAVMWVNNEVGTIQPITEIADVCAYLAVPLFVDLAQAAGRIPTDVHANRVATGAVSSHKLYGPQGIAALYCRRDLLSSMRPIASGGGQERGLSPGTLPTALIVGFGEACALALKDLDEETRRVSRLRDTLMQALLEGCPGATVNGSIEHRVAGNLNISFPGIDADALLAHLPGVVASTGSACSSGAIAPSRTLLAMGLASERTSSAIRFGLGRETTSDQIDRAAALVIHAVQALTTEAGR